MNQGIPKSVRDALANKRQAEDHPSPDLLNGYVEQSLSATEKSGVTHHLAVCEDCREVVFLASAAASQPFDAAIIEPARVWRGWKWLVPAVAMLALVFSALVERPKLFAPRPVAMQAANHQANALPSQTASSQVTTEGETAALLYSPALKSTNQQEHIRANLTDRNKRSAQDEVAAAAGAKQTPSETREALADLAKAAPSPTTPSPAVVARNAVVPSSAATAAAAPLQAAVGQAPSARAFGAPGQSSLQSMKKAAAPTGISGDASYLSLTIRSHWRITDEGHLERSPAGDDWTQVLADQPIRFRAVAVVGNDVWAGGNNGALFHSVDGGGHWAQAVLSADGHPETGAVVSINFDTVSQGSVRTETGSTWTTSDRGQSWNK